MRLLYWIIGALAAAAGGAYVADRRARRRVSERFLEALRKGPVVVEAYEPSIVASGLRAEAFRGTVAGTPFLFVGRTDVSGTRWSFGLLWNGARVTVAWNPVADGPEHPLSEAYHILRRRASTHDGTLN